MLPPPDRPDRHWEAKRLRHRLFWLTGRLARHARRTVLHLIVKGQGQNGPFLRPPTIRND